MTTIKLTALSVKGKALVSINVSPGETYDDIIAIFTGKLREDPARIAFVSDLSQWRDAGYIIKNEEMETGEKKFRISSVEPWKIYEDTGSLKRDRMIMYATPTGDMLEGVGLGKETAQLYEAVPSDLIEMALGYWKEK